MDSKLQIDMRRPPKVLFLGNGILRLGSNGTGWDDLLCALSPDGAVKRDVRNIPNAMQPEAIRGTDVEEVQQLTAACLASQEPHDVLKKLVFLDFDAILTTNYTYEIERALMDGKWNDNRRKRCHTTLCGSPHVLYNTCKCNLVKDVNGRIIPVFHVHGELARKRSLVLSYYSYADAVYHLIEMNKRRKNDYEEHQQSGSLLTVQGWLDYFLMGEVYAVGFGFDLSEFDIWWAAERKSREHADKGALHAYMISNTHKRAKSSMLQAMRIDERFFRARDGQYEKAYLSALEEIKKRLQEE